MSLDFLWQGHGQLFLTVRDLEATRAYWMFRYWGFPQENLKLLNGGNDAFAADHPELMTMDVPTPEASDFSVGDLDAELQGDLRLSVGDMLGLVGDLDSATDVVLDARPDPYAGAGSSPAYTSSKGDFVVYDGHPEGGQTLSWVSLFVDPANGDYRFKTKADIEALFVAKGWGSHPIYNCDGFNRSLQHQPQLISWRFKSKCFPWSII